MYQLAPGAKAEVSYLCLFTPRFFGHISFAGIASPVAPASGGQGGGRVGGQGGGGGAQVGGRGKDGQDDGKDDDDDGQDDGKTMVMTTMLS